MRTFARLAAGAILVAAAPLSAQAPVPAAPAAPAPLDSATLAGFRWRSVGPANMAGRITDIEGIPAPSKTFYVAAATGGIWKTTNAGTTFRPVFDNQRVVSMGDLAIAPSDTNVVYAGTGEEDSRNSISPGGGLYKSTDGGKSWKLMGLSGTQHIGRIVVHPKDANIVYVAALGHAWGPNPERGLYKSTDGGATWQLSKFISDKAGFVDLAMDPTDPNTLYASSWERVRGPYFLKSGGPGSALWKTTDGGNTWKEITGGGFPTSMKGRIGIAIAQSNPKVVYALVEADTNPNATVDAKVKAQTRPSGLYRSADGGATWTKMNSNDVRPFYYSQVRVDTKNPDRVYWSSTPVNFSEDGGKTVRNATLGIHVDHHAMWIDPNDPEHFIVGDDGGVSQTWDRGGNYDFLNLMPLGQFYEVSYDFAVPYRVCGGLQDNGSWCGPSRRRNGSITNAHWFTVGGGDGFFTAQDPTNPDIIYSESQGGSMGRLNYATGDRQPLRPPGWRPRYTVFEDSIILTRGDTTQPAPKEVARKVADLKAREKADSIDLDLRFNWDTPFFLSAHNPATMYVGGSRVLKSTNRGDTFLPISPDLSLRDMAKIDTSIRKTGGITPDPTGAETYGTVVALAESPVRPGLLYAGTDDGNVWLSRNDGTSWESLNGRFPGVPPRTYVRRIEPSHFDSATFYVAFDGHRTDDFTPYLFVTTDFGKTFKSIVNNLPRGGPDFVHVVREDPANRDLLFAGTDVGIYVSLDRGGSWQRFMTNFPTVPVHDLKIHPRDHELIAGTHGRSIWIVDITPLEQMTTQVVAKAAYLFAPKTAYQFGESPTLGESPGHKLFQGQSPQYGAEIAYRLTVPVAPAAAASGGGEGGGGVPEAGRQQGAPAALRIVITNVTGDTIRTLTGPSRVGLHRVVWDFRGKAPAAAPLSPSGIRDSIIMARKIEKVFDSLTTAGVSKLLLDRVRGMIGGGDEALAQLFRGGGGGGRGGAAGVFAERPGESAAGAQGRGAAAAAGAARGEGAGAAGGGEVDIDALQPILGAFRGLGGGGGGGGGLAGLTTRRGGAAPNVRSGDYLVSITVNGQTMRQVLRVERMAELSDVTSFFDDEDDDAGPLPDPDPVPLP